MGLKEYEIQELTKVAYNLLDSGENAKAIEYFENAARKAKEAGNASAIITSYLNAGACLVTQGEHHRGRAFLQSALKLLESTSTEGHSPSSPDLRGTVDLKKGTVMRLTADIYHYLGVAYHELNDDGSAVDHLTTSIKLYSSEGLPKLAAESLTCMSHCYRELGTTEKEIQTLKKLSEVYHELGDISNEAETCMVLAKVFLKERKTSYVKQMLSTSRMLCQRVDNEDGSKFSFHSFVCSFIHSQKVVYVCHYSTQVDFPPGKLYCELGLLYSSLGSFDLAIDCFERALAMTQKLPRTGRALQSEASILQNIGAVYNEKSMFSEAVAYHQEAIAIHGQFVLSTYCFCIF